MILGLLVVAWPFPAAGHQSSSPHSGPGAHSYKLLSGVNTPSWPKLTSVPSSYAQRFGNTSYITPKAPSGACAGSPTSPVSYPLDVNVPLPAGAVDPGIVVRVYADDAVALRLNSQVFGGQPKAVNKAHSQSPAETFTDMGFTNDEGSFVPLTNSLEFELINFGQKCALDFTATISFSLPCPKGVPTFVGGDASETLNGTPGNDIIDGGDGDDVIFGKGGNDILIGGRGNDVLSGGGGNDCLLGGDDNDKLLGQSGNDTLRGGDEEDKLDGGVGDDALRGDDHNDTLEGGSGSDILSGERKDDRLDGGSGYDSLSGGDNNDTLFGGLGHDSLFGGDGDDNLSDTAPGNDFDALNGGVDTDTLNTKDNDGNDTMWGPATPLIYGPYPSVDPVDTCVFDSADATVGCP